MRIAIDASRTTVQRVTGTEHYATELIRAMIKHNRKHELALYFRDAPPADLFPESERVSYHVIPFKRAWTHIRFAWALWRDRPDVTFVPAHTLPFIFPGKGAVTVHDLGYKHFPQAHTTLGRFYLNLTTQYSTRRAQRIFADSRATADDIITYYQPEKQRILVVYPGVEAPQHSENDITVKYQLPQRYFLFIGTLQPRKNIEGLVKAYRAYRERVNQPADLVLAGGKGWLFDERWLEGAVGVHQIGYIDEEDKGNLMEKALALVFPSFYEGFGFPVVEAMHCGLPVIASDTSSLPELMGEAGIQVPPDDPFAIARAMIRIEADEDLRRQLREAGYQQIRQFSWTAAALKVLRGLELLDKA